MLETNQTIIKHKLGLLNLAEELGNVSKACKVMGLSRDTFYRYKAAVDDGGVEALFDKTRRKRSELTQGGPSVARVPAINKTNHLIDGRASRHLFHLLS